MYALVTKRPISRGKWPKLSCGSNIALIIIVAPRLVPQKYPCEGHEVLEFLVAVKEVCDFIAFLIHLSLVSESEADVKPDLLRGHEKEEGVLRRLSNLTEKYQYDGGFLKIWQKKSDRRFFVCLFIWGYIIPYVIYVLQPKK